MLKRSDGQQHNIPRTLLLALYKAAYANLARPLLFTQDAQTAHAQALQLLRYLDAYPGRLAQVHQALFRSLPVTVGGVDLASPLMLAAGLVKGDGFADEAVALAAVQSGAHIIPGWRAMPALVGVVEFGSFTRYPRLGNAGTVVWRDVATRSTQNRVGLKNPGALAAAAFLAGKPLPATFGINLAPTPSVFDLDQEQHELSEALDAFLQRGVRPAWFTLNLSCPNTEDDPGAHQTAARAQAVCRHLVNRLQGIPLWVKISPNLADGQYDALLKVCHNEGVRAVIATNTQPEPLPNNAKVSAGVGGGRLHQRAVAVAGYVTAAVRQRGYALDVIGCGGVQTPAHYAAFAHHGVRARQYWSALVFGGPLAAACILNDIL
ncbi:MAG: hypothetical protein H7Y11_06075 [Armatimonadetes bacterium]|nr:hypothetical protein [Anaerolineae bacterium]